MAMCTGFASKRWMAIDSHPRGWLTGPIVGLPRDCLPRLEILLTANGLPADDCAEQLAAFHAIFDDGRLVAAGGLETAGEFALLRSVVVHPEYRRRGLAARMTEFLLQLAREQEIKAVYLLTETAADYFEQRGFNRVDRASAPAEISATRQFEALCPDSAICLMCDPGAG